MLNDEDCQMYSDDHKTKEITELTFASWSHCAIRPRMQIFLSITFSICCDHPCLELN